MPTIFLTFEDLKELKLELLSFASSHNRGNFYKNVLILSLRPRQHHLYSPGCFRHQFCAQI